MKIIHFYQWCVSCQCITCLQMEFQKHYNSFMHIGFLCHKRSARFRLWTQSTYLQNTLWDFKNRLRPFRTKICKSPESMFTDQTHKSNLSHWIVCLGYFFEVFFTMNSFFVSISIGKSHFTKMENIAYAKNLF